MKKSREVKVVLVRPDVPNLEALETVYDIFAGSRAQRAKEHRWSGWPGAFCLDCFHEDGTEIAIALNDYDPYTGWKDEETRLRYEREYPKECSAKTSGT